MRVAALGYYGFGNLGDEAVLAGIRTALAQEAAFADLSFLVLTHSASATRQLHPGVETVDRWRWRSVAAALRGVDLFVLGGGSLFQDATSIRSVLWYAAMAILARRRARRVLWWAQGIGPLRTPLARRVVAAVARQADSITVRDRSSAALLKEIGVAGSIEVVADPAFALVPGPAPANAAQTLLCVRGWKQYDLGVRLLAGEGLQGAPGPLEAVPMHVPDDRVLLPPDLARYDWESAGAGLPEILARFSQARLVVAMRLHSLIFAARCGVPFVALSYDPKVDALAEAAGQSDALLSVARADPTQVAEVIDRVLSTERQRRERLAAFGAEQCRRAQWPAQGAARWWE